ncbi:MAG: hypothetical protein FWE03_02070 [Firmicutes bacterium]|nr:hypothetical protein [Bacillota bacterium]
MTRNKVFALIIATLFIMVLLIGCLFPNDNSKNYENNKEYEKDCNNYIEKCRCEYDQTNDDIVYEENEDNNDDDYEKYNPQPMIRTIFDQPYIARHNNIVQDGVFYELPVLRSGRSNRPALDRYRQPLPQFSRSPHDLYNMPPVSKIDCYDDLNQMRLGRADNNHAIAHAYTREFFENYALLFVNVRTGSSVRNFIEVETLVTCSLYLHPVVSLNWSPPNHGNWDHAMETIVSVVFLLEIPNVLLYYYDFGTIFWTEGSNRSTQISNEQIVSLTNTQKKYCYLEFGLEYGKPDCILVQHDYVLQFHNDRYRFVGFSPNAFNLSSLYNIYVRHENSQDFVYADYSFVRTDLNSTSWSTSFFNLNLKPGLNTIKIISRVTYFKDGFDIRTYGYAEIFLNHEIINSPYLFNIENVSTGPFLSWNGHHNYQVFIRQAGSDQYTRRSTGIAGTLYSGRNISRGISLRHLGLVVGTNTILISRYGYNDGVVTKYETRWPAEIDSVSTNYEFILSSDARYILWDGAGSYRVWLRSPNSDNFILVHSLFRPTFNLERLNLSPGLHQIRVESLINTCANGRLVITYAVFSFCGCDIRQLYCVCCLL